MTYDQILEKKRVAHISSGFDIPESALNQKLFLFQRFIVRRALAAGKYAIFADCGLGKTFMQLEWAYCVYEQTKKPVLVLAPLAVVDQTIEQGEFFNIPAKWYDGSDFPIQVANYDQLDNIDVSIFSGIVLDESGILKNYEAQQKTLSLKNSKLPRTNLLVQLRRLLTTRWN